MQLELADPPLARPAPRPRRAARVPMPRRRCDAATISPRSATCALAGCWSRAIERRPTISPSSSADEHRGVLGSGGSRVGSGARPQQLRQPLVVISQRPGSQPTAVPSSTRPSASRVGRADASREAHHSTTMPWPPRRGSPAAASSPSPAPRPPDAPPKKRFWRRQRDDVPAHRLEPVQLRRLVTALAVQLLLLEVDPRPLERLLHASGRAPTTLTTTWITAPRRRSDPALPTTRRGPPSRSDDRRRHHARQPRARARRRGEVELADHVVDVDAGARDDDRPSRTPVEAVSAAALPLPSTTEMCVVRPAARLGDRRQRGRDPSERAAHAPPADRRSSRRGQRAFEAAAAHAPCSRITPASASIASALPGAPAAPSRSSSRSP